MKGQKSMARLKRLIVWGMIYVLGRNIKSLEVIQWI